MRLGCCPQLVGAPALDLGADLSGWTDRRRQLASELAEHQDGVASRSQLAALGISRHDVRSEVDGGRWRRHGRQTIAVHTGPLTTLARRWAALFETGTAIAAIDGVTALQHAGLTGSRTTEPHVSAVHNHNTERLAGARIHKVIRRVSGELTGTGLTRTRPEVAAVRAAHWARPTGRHALILLMTVQQRLTTPMRLAAAQRLVPRAHPIGASSGRSCETFGSESTFDVRAGRTLHDADLVVEVDGPSTAGVWPSRRTTCDRTT